MSFTRPTSLNHQSQHLHWAESNGSTWHDAVYVGLCHPKGVHTNASGVGRQFIPMNEENMRHSGFHQQLSRQNAKRVKEPYKLRLVNCFKEENPASGHRKYRPRHDTEHTRKTVAGVDQFPSWLALNNPRDVDAVRASRLPTIKFVARFAV